VQGDARRRLRAARVRAVLEALDQPRGHAGGHLRARRLARPRVPEARRRHAPAAGRPHRQLHRHARRLPRPALAAARSDYLRVLVGFILLYLAVSLGVGLYASTRVRGAADYAVAGKRFGTTVVTATVF